MSVDDDLSDLIGLVYEAVLEPDLWSLVLRETATHLRADSGLLGIGSARRPSEGIAVPLSFEIDPVQQARWVEAYLARDEWWLAFSERFDEGVLTGADCVEPRQLHRTPIYNEVLVRAGIEDGIFAGIDRAPGADSIATFYRGRTRKTFGHAEVDVLSFLLPHLRRAVRISDRFALVRSERDASRAAEDSVAVGVIYLDGRRRMVGANANARRFLAEEDMLVIREGRLHALDPTTNADLGSAISASLERLSRRPGRLVRVRKPPEQTSAIVYVSPIAREVDRPLLGRRDDRAEVVVLVASEEAFHRWPIPEAANALGLSPAESELALALALGHDLEAYAEGRKITLGTARWRMKRIFEKTGTRRQSDVVRLVMATLGRIEPGEGGSYRAAAAPAGPESSRRTRSA